MGSVLAAGCKDHLQEMYMATQLSPSAGLAEGSWGNPGRCSMQEAAADGSWSAQW